MSPDDVAAYFDLMDRGTNMAAVESLRSEGLSYSQIALSTAPSQPTTPPVRPIPPGVAYAAAPRMTSSSAPKTWQEFIELAAGAGRGNAEAKRRYDAAMDDPTFDPDDLRAE